MREKVLQIGVYCVLLWKRMWKLHKVYFLFCLAPLVVLAIESSLKTEETRLHVAVCMENAEEKENPEAELFEEELRERLEAKGGILVFSFYNTEEEVRQQVAAAKAECGYCIGEDFVENLKKKRYNRLIRSYESPQSSMQRLCEEVLFTEIFTVYEEMTFGQQAADLLSEELEKTVETERKTQEGESIPQEGEFGQQADDAGKRREELVERAEELFEKYRYNGSTFQFTYENYSGTEGAKTAKEQENQVTKNSAGEIETHGTQKTGRKILRGVLALQIFVCGLCGTMDTLEDEKHKRLVRLRGGRFFRIFTIYLPILFMSAVTLLCLMAEQHMQGFVEETIKLILYQLILMVYCLLLKKVCRKEEHLAAAIPVLILLTVVVCPVFVDLSQFVPAFRILEKVFPVAYYLRM